MTEHPTPQDVERVAAGLIVRPFDVTVSGFSPITYFAASRGKAMSKAFGDYRNYDGRVKFKDFLRIARVRSASVADPRFGERMTICGKPAFYVSHNRQYIQFVRPGSDVIMNSHPLDVEPPEARRGTPYYQPTQEQRT